MGQGKKVFGRAAIAAGLAFSSACAASDTHRAAPAQAPDRSAQTAAGRDLQARILNPAALEAFFDGQARQGFAGVVLVERGDRVLLRRGYGNAGGTAAFAPDTAFDLGSLTKQFTATAILLLEQDGRLRTTDRLSDHLANVPPDKAAITIHQLLTHSSGLADLHGRDLEPVDQPEALRRIFAQQLAFAPGAGRSYSNSGYTLLAAIVERVAGRPFLAYMRARLLSPLGLDGIGWFREERWQGRTVAHGFLNDEDMGNPATWAGPYWTVMGNGEWLATADDLMKWHKAVSRGRILNAQQAARLWSPHVRDAGAAVAWGYGWRTCPTAIGPMIFHGGVGNGGNAEFAYFPGLDLRMVIFSNRVTMRRLENPARMQILLPARSARDELIGGACE